jgi:hypothetical protein
MEAEIATGYASIEGGWSAKDVTWDAKGRCTFNLTNGKIALGENFGARLVACLPVAEKLAKAA